METQTGAAHEEAAPGPVANSPVANGVVNSRFTEKEDSLIDEKADDKTELEKIDLVTPAQSNIDDIIDQLDKFTSLPRILREGILLTGGGVAILLQAAKTGMVTSRRQQNSKILAEQLFEGLRHTVIDMYGLVFGTRDEKKQILERASQHQSPQYYPEEPQLRLWIVATLYATATDFYQRVFEKVEYHAAQRVYREFSILVIEALRLLPRGVWPEDRNAFWAYWDEELDKLEVDSRARPVVHDLQAYNNVPTWVKLIRGPFIRAVTPEMLPPHVREQYGLKSTAASRFWYRFAIGGAKAVYPTLPKGIRTHPKNRALRQIRGI
jgi:uncharacterized protein (DUF2236 family)